jgi:heavy metal efflux system protein
MAGLYLSVPASVGFIGPVGVAVLNGVLLVSAVSQSVTDGMPHAGAILAGAEARLRPVPMTTSIFAFSLLPMMFATGPGSEVQRPLAVVVVGGLITSTALALLVMPAFYEWFDRGERRVRETGQ